MAKVLNRTLSTCVIFSLFSMAFIFHGFAQNPHVTNISTNLSFQDVSAFAQDSLGYMWVATLGGLNRYNGYEFKQFLHDSSEPGSLPDNFVFSLFVDSAGNLWVGTAAGVCRYNFDTETFIVYEGVPTSMTTYGFFEDHTGQIWTATEMGPGLIDPDSCIVTFPGPRNNVKQFWEDDGKHLWMGLAEKQGLAVRKNGIAWEYYVLPGNRQVNCMYADPQGIWWLGTNDGIVLFNPDTFSFSLTSSMFPAETGLNKSHITFIKEIEPLKVMIGTETEGFYLYDLMTKELNHNMPARYNPRNSAQLHTCYVDWQKNVWIGTYDKGIVIGNKQSDYFNPNKLLSDKIKEQFVTRVVEDHGGNLWIGTRYNGLYRYSKSGKFNFYSVSDLLPDNSEFLEVVYIDSQDRVWIAFQSKLVVAGVNPDGKIRIDRRLDIDNVRVVKEDQNHNFWLGTWNGLYKTTSDLVFSLVECTQSSNITDICIKDSGDVLYSAYGIGVYEIKTNDSVPVQITFSEEDLMTSKCVITLFIDSQNRLWMGSYGNGLLCRSVGRSIRMTTADGLSNNNVLCIKEDLHGDIWASTSHGISRLKPKGDGFSVTNFYSSDILPGDQYHEKSGCRTSDGMIFFGGNHGLTFFNPSSFASNSTPPLIHIEDLKIHNHSVCPAPEGSVLSRSILLTDAIVLDHRQRMISLDYAGIDFYTSNNLTYKYRLDGFDENWNYVGAYRRASYSNLPPGTYTFRVSAINEEGIESATPALLKITVKSAPWLTWKAWTAYSFLLACLVFFLLRAFLNARLNKQRAKMEHNEKEREKEISKMKITFFTNISHELRTPLTLISAPLEKLLGNKDMDDESRRQIAVANRNANRMHHLINQLMDVVKIENGVLSLHVRETDIMDLLSKIHESFNYVANQKGIELVFQPHTPSLMIRVDADKVETILYNLVSNAIKHTPRTGCVTISTRNCGDNLEISVSDTGEGVPPEKLGELFVRYRIVNGSPDYSGNGIGLHYTKTLVEMHKGNISARIRPGGGMVFSFTLPMNDVYSDQEQENGEKEVIPSLTAKESPAIRVERESDEGKSGSILVVEDNVELRQFIVDLLSDTYKVSESSDGLEALECIKQTPVDLILSDVIMPGLSGYDLCARVKQNQEFCHIPVVLLTAKTSIPEQIKGLETGADAYICKPFSIDYLLLTIRNLLHRKELLRQYFSMPESDIARPIQESLSKHDQAFLDKLMKLVTKELSNADLNVDQIAVTLGYSRTILYRKIKGLTNLSPNDFIRNYRFKRAAELITEGSLQLVEVAEQTGFASYSYFSKAFKQHFGVTPKEYQAKKSPGSK
ncbi:MAG: response regulator [Bacteroidales bacterium]|jgi:signal transduction histidine kinase/ligand-binding sensor domain-containing protein/DNA-binding response OmpR family regulator|nr:response regulator [Bacteroidales bacterium]